MIFKKNIDCGRKIIGIGAANAFPFIIPSYFLKDYSIMCIRDRKDTRLIKKHVQVFCVEDLIPNVNVAKVNQQELLDQEVSQEYLSKFDNPFIFVRKTTPSTQHLTDEKHLKLLGNSKTVRDPFENKLIFRQTLESIGIKTIDGFSIPYREMNFDVIKKAQSKLGEKLVLQAAELTHGGGVGTGFIEDKNDYDTYMDRMDRVINLNGRKIENINITKFVSGTPSSVLGCVTKFGVIVGSIQTQIQDIPEVCNLSKGDGVYCGHDWYYKKTTRKIYDQVYKITSEFGKKISQSGYKGIFGLDLIIDYETGQVYPIECNPRYTDALPVASFLAMEKRINSLEYYHFLEHLGLDYKLNIKRINKRYRRQFKGSQILLMSKSDSLTKNNKELQAGIYEYKNGDIFLIKESFEIKDIRNKNQFLITDGVPFANTTFKSRSRIARLLFKKSILKNDKELEDDIKDLINLIYNKFEFKEIRK